MGESFIGLPNRFKVINNLLESTYNPNHVLSAYQGYRLSVDYVKRSGGRYFCMTGSLYTATILPNVAKTYDIGASDQRYGTIYADVLDVITFRGNATSASKLNEKRTITLTGSVTGSVETDFSGTTTIDTTTNHNHDDLYVKKTGNSPYDPITGPLYVRSLTPTEDKQYSLGTSAKRFAAVYAESLFATNISGELSGNASTATKFSNARSITVSLKSTADSDSVSSSTGSAAFDGSKDITISLKAPYLPLSGGQINGSLSITGDLLTTGDPAASHSIGNQYTYWGNLYVSEANITTLHGTVDGNASTATKLKTARNINIQLLSTNNPSYNYGSASFDGSGNITINVGAPFLPISGGNISGDVYPDADNSYYLGTSSLKFKSIFAKEFYGDKFVGSLEGAAAKLQTARTITLSGSVTGSVSFDGSSDVTITTTTNHNHDDLYVKKTGGTPSDPITGPLYVRQIIPTEDDAYALGTAVNRFATVRAVNIYGELNGNASTTTKLATARNINGTSFDGSSDITTANWGTARNITIGNSTKSVNGSANVSWSLSEIGAADASVVGSTVYKYKAYEYKDSVELGSISEIELEGDSDVWFGLMPGTYVMTAMLYARALPKVLSIAIKRGASNISAKLDASSQVIIPSCPIYINSSGNVSIRTTPYMHRIQSTSIFTLTETTNVYPSASVQPITSWTDYSFSYSLFMRCIRIK